MQNKMKLRTLSVILLTILLFVPIFSITTYAYDTKNLQEIELCTGGMPFGVKISSPGLTIVRFTATKGKNASSAYLSGLREGDIITHVNGVRVTSIEGFIKEIDKAGASTLSITALRNGKEMNFSVQPKYSRDDGRYKTGIFVKDTVAGIGTVTFIDPQTGTFGGLGHAISDSQNGNPTEVSQGTVMDVKINGVIKGQAGAPGELEGAFSTKRTGKLLKNCNAGVFGVLTDTSSYETSEKIKICPKEEIKTGDAYIKCTLNDGGVGTYKVKIFDIDTSNSGVKNFKIKVTDKKLLELSGGIVQGMSGSPVIQDGKLVGAVTHVLINDPTTGYGIFIENMLNQI